MNQKGFIPVMLTPFDENKQVDYDALTRLTEFYIDAGAQGLFANCLSSEMYELTAGERLDVTAHVVNTANGRVPVVATGTFGGSLVEQAEFIKQIYQTGIEAVIIIGSMIVPEQASDDEFEEKIYQLLALTPGIPMGFYECPEPYKRLISPELLARFVETGRVIYHKDTCLNIDDVTRKNLLCAVNPQFGLYDAYMAHAVASLKSGSRGLSCIQGNYFPELIVWLCNNYDNPDMQAEVDSVQEFFVNEMDIMHTCYPISAKYFLKKRGLPVTLTTRRDLPAAEDCFFSELDDLYERFQTLHENVGINLVTV